MSNELQKLINSELSNFSLSNLSGFKFKEEISSHIFEKANDLVLLGKSEKEAVHIAIKDFGDLQSIAESIEKVHQDRSLTNLLRNMRNDEKLKKDFIAFAFLTLSIIFYFLIPYLFSGLLDSYVYSRASYLSGIGFISLTPAIITGLWSFGYPLFVETLFSFLSLKIWKKSKELSESFLHASIAGITLYLFSTVLFITFPRGLDVIFNLFFLILYFAARLGILLALRFAWTKTFYKLKNEKK